MNRGRGRGRPRNNNNNNNNYQNQQRAPYQQRYEDYPPQEQAERAPPPIRGRGASRGQKRSERSEQGRIKLGEPQLEQVTKDLDARLFAEYEDVNRAFTALHITAQKRAATLSTGTRGVGFLLTRIHNRILAQTNLDIPIFAFYRIALLQLQSKSNEVVSKQHMMTIHPTPQTTLLPLEIDRTVRAVTVNFAPITMLINGYGNFNHLDTQYYPYLSNEEALTISNLRTWAVRMSDPLTPLEERIAANQQSSVPGAVWENHLLVNPDTIVPHHYGLANVVQDIDNVKGAYARITHV